MDLSYRYSTCFWKTLLLEESTSDSVAKNDTVRVELQVEGEIGIEQLQEGL